MQLDLNFDGSPTPNEHGVYQPSHTFVLAHPKMAWHLADILLLELPAGQYIAASSVTTGGGGYLSPLKEGPRTPIYESKEQAIAAELNTISRYVDSATSDRAHYRPPPRDVKMIRDWVTAQRKLIHNNCE